MAKEKNIQIIAELGIHYQKWYKQQHLAWLFYILFLRYYNEQQDF